MTRPLSGERIATLAQAACLIEVSAPKPGNVSPGRDFADTTFEDFLLSAAAIGPAFARVSERGVGPTVLAAVEATRRLVTVNTNLGMILLLAPLACAAARDASGLRQELARVLGALSHADARGVFAAIRLVNPGGLGSVPAEDVRAEPTATLGESMALAAERDSIAREYTTGYDLTFRLGLPEVRTVRGEGASWAEAGLAAYLRLLAEVPDSLIARKEGRDAARAVSARAREVLGAGRRGSPERGEALAAFDRELRSRANRLNPGTSADLVAAALFVALAEEG